MVERGLKIEIQKGTGNPGDLPLYTIRSASYGPMNKVDGRLNRLLVQTSSANQDGKCYTARGSRTHGPNFTPPENPTTPVSSEKAQANLLETEAREARDGGAARNPPSLIGRRLHEEEPVNLAVHGRGLSE
jgi:hypothetical protein